MKSNIKITMACAMFAIGGLTSCSNDDISTFDNNNYLSFTSQAISYTFAFEDEGVVKKDFEIEMEYAGRYIYKDAQMSIEVVEDKSTAVKGVDYLPLDMSKQVFPAGKNVGNAVITLLRTQKQKEEEATLVLAIHANESFLVGYQDTLRLFVSDKLIKPSWWAQYSSEYIGDYEETKMLLLLEFMGIENGSDPFDDPEYYYYTDRGTGNFIYKNLRQSTLKPKTMEFRYWLIHEKGDPVIPGTDTPISETLGKWL